MSALLLCKLLLPVARHSAAGCCEMRRDTRYTTLSDTPLLTNTATQLKKVKYKLNSGVKLSYDLRQ